MRIRPERVAHLMRREVADIIENRLRDPRLSAMVSVTDVEITHDLSFGRVFVSIHGSADDQVSTLALLNKAAGFVRRDLGPRMGLREVPEIRFLLDDSLERGARVDTILRKLERGEPIEDDEK